MGHAARSEIDASIRFFGRRAKRGAARPRLFRIFATKKYALPLHSAYCVVCCRAMAKPAREPLPPLHRPSSVPSGARPKQGQNAGSNCVIATQLAKHLDLSRQRVQQLVEEYVIARLPNGKFDQDACRVAYLRWVRDPERRLARSQADADFVKAKTALIAIRVREKKRELIEFEEAKAVTEKAIGIVLVAMSGMVARCAGSDLQLRRKIDQVVYETRVQLANTFNRFADEAGAPPLLQDPATDNIEEDDKL
jgi:hypothetical protein